MMVVKSSSGDYTVQEVATLADAIAPEVVGDDVFALVDRHLFDLEHSNALSALKPSRTLRIEATEEEKSYGRCGRIFEWLLESGFRRGGSLLAVGGGVIQDIACFVASVLFRGVPWELVPTTLLAQCDSCIGSKSSLNVGAYKNQIGTFYPPRRVLLVNDVLETLAADEIRSGLGEVIKLHLIAGGAEYEQLADIMRHGIPTLPQIRPLVASSLRIKKRFIEEDEFDRGVRNILNYGHTFGHAYESVTAYGIPHGIAVTLGVLSATFVSEDMGLAPRGYFQKLNELLRPYYAPYEQKLAEADTEAIVRAMKLDKKSTRNEVNCILTEGAGRMRKVSLDAEIQIRPLLDRLKSAIH